MGPFRAHGPSAGPAEVNGLPEAHGPPKVHGPQGHCTPCPPLRGPVVPPIPSLVGPGYSPPPLACRPKCRIKKYHVFSAFETVLCARMD